MFEYAEKKMLGTTHLKKMREGFVERAAETVTNIPSAVKSIAKFSWKQLTSGRMTVVDPTGNNFQELHNLQENTQRAIATGKAIISDYANLIKKASDGDDKAVGALGFEAVMLFLPEVKASGSVRFAGEFGKCVEFASEFRNTFEKAIKVGGGDIKVFEINIGGNNLIGTTTQQLSNNGMHQFVEAVIGGKTKIFDNLHPNGMLKEEYMKEIEGFSRTEGVISGKDLLEKYTTEIPKKNKK